MRQLKLTMIALFAFAATANAQWFGSKKVKGNGNVVKINRSTSDYEGIKCAGSMDYILVAGKEGAITIEGEENLLEYIVTEVKGGKLVVKVENGVSLRPSWNKSIKITIPFEDINSVSLSGSGDVWNENIIKTNELDVALAGSGDIVLDVQTESVNGSVSGSGDLTLKGSTNYLKASVAGSGDFHGFKLDANHTTAAVAGSGDVAVVSKESLKARVSGSGDIEYRGNPKKEDTKVSGSGSISN